MSVNGIGVIELRKKTAEILRRVRLNGESFEITYRGRPVAELRPVESPDGKEDWRRIWANMDRTAESIANKWPTGVSAADAVREQRRDL